MSQLLTIGKVARRADVNIDTIRYYERRGLLPNPMRTEAGYRLYDIDSVARIRFIREAQQLGFSLVEIQDLLSMRIDASTSCDEVRSRAEGKVGEIRQKIRALQEMEAVLGEMIAACSDGGPQGACPFLTILEERANREKGYQGNV